MTKIKRLPLLLLPFDRAKQLSKRFRNRAKSLLKTFPSTTISLKQARLDVDARDYVTVVMFSSIMNFLLFTPVVFIVLMMFMREINPLTFLISLGIGIAFFFVTFLMQMRYPGVKANKRRRAMESNVLFVLRDLLIKMKSGISLFDAMSGIARAGHGEISTEFEVTTQEMTAGISQIDALNRMALRTPSKNLRRVIWQLANALRAGADISSTIAAIVQDMSEEQRVKIKNFGAELNPLAMVYMMVNIIMPTMGITFIIVLSSFMSMPVNETTFYMILLMLFMFQIMFVGMLKSKRQEISV